MKRRGSGRQESVLHRGAARGSVVGLPPEAEALEAVIEGSVGVSFSDGNTVEVLEDEQALRRLAEDVARARHSVTFQVYYIEKGRVLDEFAELFRARAEADVRVLVLVDAFGTKRLSPRDIQRMVGDRVRVARLRGERLRHPLRFLHRAHCRSCVIDGAVAYTGGFGLADKWDPSVREGPSWRELAVRITGPAVLRLQSRFSELWAEARGGEVLKGSELFSARAIRALGDTTAGLLISSPTQPVSSARRLLEVLCAEARSRLWIYSGYFAPSPDQRRHLEAAARRGVDVRILTSNQTTDLPLIRLSGRGNFPPLLDAGVRIWEYQPRMLHAKAFLLDDWLMGVGTMNVDPVSEKLNDETVLIAVDESLTRSLSELFLQDLQESAEIRLEALRGQPLRQRVLERACAWMVRVP